MQLSKVPVKADNYSFGIELLEVVIGRKILDYSQPDSEVHLLHISQEKYVANQLMDIVDTGCEDSELNKEEFIQMINLVMWCLYTDYE